MTDKEELEEFRRTDPLKRAELTELREALNRDSTLFAEHVCTCPADIIGLTDTQQDKMRCKSGCTGAYAVCWHAYFRMKP